MADLTVTLEEVVADTTGGTTESSGSLTVGDDTLLLCGVWHADAEGVPVSSVSGFGTWSMIAESSFVSDGRNASIWEVYVETGATDTVDFASAGDGATGFMWGICSIPGAHPDGVTQFDQTADGGAAGGDTLTLAAHAHADSVVVGWAFNGAATASIADFTELGSDSQGSPNASIWMGWDSDATSIAADWGGGAAQGVAFAVEVEPAAAAAAGTKGRMMMMGAG